MFVLDEAKGGGGGGKDFAGSMDVGVCGSLCISHFRAQDCRRHLTSLISSRTCGDSYWFVDSLIPGLGEVGRSESTK